MLKHETGIFPDTDDRKDIRRMLEELSPSRRIEWLRWCCRQVSTAGVKTDVIQSDGSVRSVWGDAISLMVGSALSVRRAGDRLYEMLKGG